MATPCHYQIATAHIRFFSMYFVWQYSGIQHESWDWLVATHRVTRFSHGHLLISFILANFDILFSEPVSKKNTQMHSMLYACFIYTFAEMGSENVSSAKNPYWNLPSRRVNTSIFTCCNTLTTCITHATLLTHCTILVNLGTQRMSQCPLSLPSSLQWFHLNDSCTVCISESITTSAVFLAK